MRVKFSQNSIKFINKINEKDRERIRDKIQTLLKSIEEQGIIPFKELDIKRLSGSWIGFMRLRIGKVRVILTVDIEKDDLFIYEIDFRGDIYK